MRAHPNSVRDALGPPREPTLSELRRRLDAVRAQRETVMEEMKLRALVASGEPRHRTPWGWIVAGSTVVLAAAALIVFIELHAREITAARPEPAAALAASPAPDPAPPSIATGTLGETTSERESAVGERSLDDEVEEERPSVERRRSRRHRRARARVRRAHARRAAATAARERDLQRSLDNL